jgi:putative hemolysin
MLATFIFIAISILLIAFFEGLEIAFVSANKLSIELKKKQGKKVGFILSNFLERPNKFIAVLLIGLNIVLVVYGLLVGKALAPIWNKLNIDNYYVRLLIETVISTVVVLIFGGILPKALFRAKNDMLLHFFAPVANFFYNLLQPIASFFVNAAHWILKIIFDVKLNPKIESFSRTDLEYYYQQTKEIDEENNELNNELFENALELPNIRIRECLVPRKEIYGVEKNTSIEVLKEKFVETKLSRLIVYDENIDNIIGYVHHLDMLKKAREIDQIIIAIPAVPESMTASDLISKLTQERKSVAWVVDEFGGTSGIVTMEDVLEEIFGEIKDEYDTEDFIDKQLSKEEFILAGRLELDYLIDKYDLVFESNEAETLSGYIIEQHETIPAANEHIVIGNHEFTILNVSDTRIETVKLKVLS